MGNPLAQLLAMLQGGPMSQLPPAGVRPNYGLTGAQIQPSDILDALRNADVKSAAMPSGSKGYAPWTKSMTPSMSGKGVSSAADATAEANLVRGLRAEEADLAARKLSPIKNAKAISEEEFMAWLERAKPFWYRGK